MPRGRQTSYNYGDVSIQEFADAKISRPNCRIRKKIGNAINKETNIDDIDLTDDDLENCQKKLTKPKAEENKATQDEHLYNEFPNDIWYLISEYIRPEDVLRFALISKQTYAITTTMKFWKHLYRRYYNPLTELPVRLQLDCMTRPGGVRGCTIRSLFYTYPLFVDRLQLQSQQDFHALTKRCLVQFWYQQVNGGRFQYFYKLKRKSLPGSKIYESEQLQRKDNKSMKALRDVYLNTEEGCCLLMIESTTFHPLPRLDLIESNVVLASINNHLSRSCSHYRLEMHFTNVSGAKTASVAYEPATLIRVYDWWVPTYAKYVRQGFQPFLEYLHDEKESNNDFNGTDDDAWDFVINNF